MSVKVLLVLCAISTVVQCNFESNLGEAGSKSADESGSTSAPSGGYFGSLISGYKWSDIGSLSPFGSFTNLSSKASGEIGKFGSTISNQTATLSKSLTKPKACVGASSAAVGICHPSSDSCTSKGGFVDGPCKFAFEGTSCCISPVACNGTISSKVGYFTNVGFPSTTSSPQTCRLHVVKTSPDVQVMVLRFFSFSLAPPNATTGNCDTDGLIAIGSNGKALAPAICGENSGQHIIVPVNQSIGSISVLVGLTSSNSVQRGWSIRITQMSSSSLDLPPPGCLQFFTTTTGSFESFNFASNSVMLSGLNYAVCIQLQNGFCGLSFDANANEFNLSVDGVTQGDFVQFPPTGISNSNSTSVQFGNVLNDGAPYVIGSSAAVVVYVNTMSDSHGTGFKVSYAQSICRLS